MPQSRSSAKRFVALGNMALRGAALLCRLGLVFYIAHQLGLEAMALYGFTVGAAAIMTTISGLGISWRVTRFTVGENGIRVAARVRDRIIQRLVVQAPLVLGGGLLAVELAGRAVLPVAAAACIVMLEPVVAELAEVLVYRHRSLAGNFILFLRSGWIPIIVLLGLADPRWRTTEVVLLGWTVGLMVAIGFVLVLGLCNAAARRGLGRRIDWQWIVRSGTSSPIVFTSELGAAGLLYSDRYIVALLLGGRAAGAFTFIWSILNAVVPIVQGGVFNQMTPQLASQWHRRQWHGWLASFSDAMRHATWVSIGFGLAAMLTSLVLLHTAKLPLSVENVAFAVLMAIATVLRMRADVVHHALYSAEQDSDWIAVNILGLVLGPAMALIGIGLLGLVGAGAQMVVVAYVLYTMRLRLAQRTIRQARIAGGEQDRLAMAG